MSSKGKKEVIKLNALPRGLEEMLQVYGDPDRNGDGRPDPDWWEKNMELCDLPFALRTSWDGRAVHRQWVHRFVAPSLLDALQEIGDTVPPSYLRLCDCDRLGGVFNLRPKRRGGGLSTHSWGIAIDLNPALAPLGGPSHQPQFIIDAFRRRGWVWLGDADGMHFQACAGY